jgi:hypothetical protein
MGFNSGLEGLMLFLTEGQAGKATITSNRAKLFLISGNTGQDSTLVLIAPF